MKKRIVVGLFAGVMLATSPLLIFGCSKDVNIKEYQENLTDVIKVVKNSDSFSSRKINFRAGESYIGYAPNYVQYVKSKVDDQSAKDINEFIEIAEEYDFISAYCFNVINYVDSNLTNFLEKKPNQNLQKSFNELNKNLDNFKVSISEQENRIENMNSFFNALPEKDVDRFASSGIYNYKKGYSKYVREILDITSDNIELLDNYAHIDYKVDSEYTNEKQEDVVLYQNILLIKNNLNVLNSYFKYIVEEFSSKTPEVFDNNNQNLKTIIDQVNDVKLDYENFIKDISKKSASTLISQKDKAKIQNSSKVFMEEMKIAEIHLNDFDMYSLVYANNADLSKLSKKQNFDYEQISNYYNSTLKTWTNYYLAYFA